MAFGLGVLGLAPAVFWQTTPKELDAMLKGRFGTVAAHDALSMSDLARLMQQFPDSN